MSRKRKFPWGFAAGILILLVLAGLLVFYPRDQRPKVAFHQDFIEGNYPEIGEAELDLNNTDEVFKFIFSSLRDQVKVYPSENYYYFVFKNRGREVWGNLHLPPSAEIGQYLDFAYWIFEEDPNKSEKLFSRYKQYDSLSGLTIQKFSPLGFQISFGGLVVFFELNNTPQAVPKSVIRSGEVFVERTFDESGHQFLLIYNSKLAHFMYVLDEDRLMMPEKLIPMDGEIFIGQKSGFAFYLDGNRKILFAVDSGNVGKNNYYDGPFDQLADNFTPVGFSSKLEAAYPYARGRLDAYGRFTDIQHSRIAVTPYYFYDKSD